MEPNRLKATNSINIPQDKHFMNRLLQFTTNLKYAWYQIIDSVWHKLQGTNLLHLWFWSHDFKRVQEVLVGTFWETQNFSSLGVTILWARALVASSRISSAHTYLCSLSATPQHTGATLYRQGNSHTSSSRFLLWYDLTRSRIQTLCVNHQHFSQHEASSNRSFLNTTKLCLWFSTSL